MYCQNWWDMAIPGAIPEEISVDVCRGGVNGSTVVNCRGYGAAAPLLEMVDLPVNGLPDVVVEAELVFVFGVEVTVEVDTPLPAKEVAVVVGLMGPPPWCNRNLAKILSCLERKGSSIRVEILFPKN